MTTLIDLTHPQFSVSESEVIDAEITAYLNHCISALREDGKVEQADDLSAEFDTFYSLLWGSIEDSASAHAVVDGYLAKIFEDGACEDLPAIYQAMGLLSFQVLNGESFLKYAAGGSHRSCKHHPAYTSDSSRSLIFTIPEMAKNTLETMEEQVVGSKIPSELVVEHLSQVKDQISNEELKLNFALNFLLKRLILVEDALNTMRYCDLSCGDHYIAYGVREDGKPEPTAQELAMSTLDRLREFQFERKTLNP